MNWRARIILANIDQGLPEWVLLFADGWVSVEGEDPFLVDQEAFDEVYAHFARRGNDIVIDYEHRTLKGDKAPAAGWITDLKYEPGVGISGRVRWTGEAAGYIRAGQYRYHSPVFYVRESDQRVVALHSVALTNVPRTNNIKPILAKLGITQKQEENMKEILKKLAAKLGLSQDAGETEVLKALDDALKDKDKGAVVAKEVLEALGLKEGSDTTAVVASIGALKAGGQAPVAAKEVLDALGLEEGASASTVVASIHALKQAPKGMVSREEFNQVAAKLQRRDADDAVAAAIGAGKITEAQKDWATEYATRDLEGFKTFVAKAPVVVPVDKLPGRKDDQADAAADETTIKVAKMMGVTPDDIKKYGGGEA